MSLGVASTDLPIRSFTRKSRSPQDQILASVTKNDKGKGRARAETPISPAVDDDEPTKTKKGRGAQKKAKKGAKRKAAGAIERPPLLSKKMLADFFAFLGDSRSISASAGATSGTASGSIKPIIHDIDFDHVLSSLATCDLALEDSDSDPGPMYFDDEEEEEEADDN